MVTVKCPRCNGCGTTHRPPWVPGDQATWESTGAGQVYTCSLCDGRGLLLLTMDSREQVRFPNE